MSRLGTVLLLGTLCSGPGLAVAGCTGAPEPPSPPPVGFATPTPESTTVFDCGRFDARAVVSDRERTRRLGLADVCLRDALLRGQPATYLWVTGRGGRTVRTTYRVTGRGELTVVAASGTTERARRCTGATGLFLPGRCSREPRGSG